MCISRIIIFRHTWLNAPGAPWEVDVFRWGLSLKSNTDDEPEWRFDIVICCDNTQRSLLIIFALLDVVMDSVMTS